MRERFTTTLLISVCILCAGLAACRDAVGPAPVDPPLEDPDAVIVDGTVAFLNLEGGCWAIQVGERTNYEPRGLPDDFRRDGLPVRTAIKPRADFGSFCMIGPVVDVLWIRRR